MSNSRTVAQRYLRDSFLPGILERRIPQSAEKNARTLLLVEDEKLLANVEARSLEMEGYDVVCLSTGEDAVDMIRKNERVIDLILMDIDLGAGMDGTEAAREILKIREIPIIFLSSHTEDRIVKKTEDITSFGYVVKCNGLAVLSASIKMAFRLYDSFANTQSQKTEIEETNEELNSSLEELEEMDEELLNNCAALIDSEQKRRKAERQYRELLNNMTDGYAVHEIIPDANGDPVDCRFVAVNSAFEYLTGMQAQDLVGKTVRDVFPDTEPFRIQTSARVAVTGEAMTFEHYDEAFDRHYRITSYRTAPLQFASVFTDVTVSRNPGSLPEKTMKDKDVLRMGFYYLVKNYLGLSSTV